MKSIAECDGESGYPEFISDIHGHAVMEECEHVLSEECPAVIRAGSTLTLGPAMKKPLFFHTKPMTPPLSFFS